MEQAMTEQEKREKVKKHNAKRAGHIVKMLIAIAAAMMFFKLTHETDDIVSIMCFVMMLVSCMAALCFKMLHLGMTHCPLCGKTFGYAAWYTRSMPYRCPHCGEKLSY